MMETSHDLGAGDRGITDQKRRPKKVVDQEVVDQIMDGLKDGQPRKTLEIAKFCGFQTKQEINPTLYYMQKSRLLAKVRFAALVNSFSFCKRVIVSRRFYSRRRLVVSGAGLSSHLAVKQRQLRRSSIQL